MGNHPSHHLPQPEVERLRAKYGDKVDAVLAEVRSPPARLAYYTYTPRSYV